MQDFFPFQPLSPNQWRLVRLIQKILFGRIEHLMVRGGEPVFDPPPHIVRDFKFGGENTPRSEGACPGALKPQFHELFALLHSVGDGVIECIEVKHGTPFLMRVATNAD